ncbi:hypothetical protein [Myxococcus sp. AB025B]|uniref:hypothetical protein n=1 Tax=Myxococcus sp. AB025B TaxID=2562794 RepID=UPI0011411416|nr:hypothetical protein [Myxococcus sp. AB025B]
MNWRNWREHLGLPLYVGTLAILPLVIAGTRSEWHVWTTSPLERCLKRETPREFADEDKAALDALRTKYRAESEADEERREDERRLIEPRDAQALQASIQSSVTRTIKRAVIVSEIRTREWQALCHEAAARAGR